MHHLRPDVVHERVGRVVQRVGLGGAAQRLEGLLQARAVLHAAIQHVAWHAAVDERIVRLAVVDGLAQQELAHDELDEVLAAQAHVVRVAAAARVHLEEAERAVALVQLDVEVREAAVARALEEALGARDDLGLSLAHDAQRVAECCGVVVLQAYDAARHHAHLARGVRECGERADGVVAAGDEVLQHQLVVVIGGADVAPHLSQLLGAFDLVDLALAGDVGVLELRRVRRLRDQRVGEVLHRQLGWAALAAVEVPGAGVGDVQFVAQLVEAALLRDVVQQVEVDVGNRVAGRFQARLSRRQHARVAVVAAQHQQHTVGVLGAHLGGHALERVVEAFRLVDERLQAVVGEAARRQHLDVLRGQHDGALDAVGAVQLADVAVGQDVAAYDDGLQSARDVGGRCDAG